MGCFVYSNMIDFVTRRMSLVTNDLPILPEHLSSPSVFIGISVARSLVFSVVFCRSLFVLLSFGHCIFYPSSNYGFSLPIVYLQSFMCLWIVIDFKVCFAMIHLDSLVNEITTDYYISMSHNYIAVQ